MLFSECQGKQAVAQLNTKIDEAIARKTNDIGGSNNPGEATPTTPTSPTMSEEERQAEEKKQWCNTRYTEAVTYFKEKNYTKAKSAIEEFTSRCGQNTQLERISQLIEEATKPPPPENRPIKSFMLRFPKAYLVNSGTTIQFHAGNPISYGKDW